MKAVIIHGQNHKGSTYHIARMLTDKLDCAVTEFFLPRDFGEFCCGCLQCFGKSETKCPHYQALAPITAAIDDADLIILASPVYVYHATGAMKALLDHYGWRWMVHRPDEMMFRKQGVCISKTYKYGVAVSAVDWNSVSEKKKRSIEKAVDALAQKITAKHGRVSSGLKTKGFFNIMRLLQKRGWNETDVAYWKEKGWTGKKRPWRE